MWYSITVENKGGSPLSKLPLLVEPKKWNCITSIYFLWEQK